VKAQHFDSWFEGLWVVERGEGGKGGGGEGGIFFAGEVVLFCLCRFCMSPSWPVKKILSKFGVNLHLEALLFSLGGFLF
jgi:hypothetical protein